MSGKQEAARPLQVSRDTCRDLYDLCSPDSAIDAGTVRHFTVYVLLHTVAPQPATTSLQALSISNVLGMGFLAVVTVAQHQLIARSALQWQASLAHKSATYAAHVFATVQAVVPKSMGTGHVDPLDGKLSA